MKAKIAVATVSGKAYYMLVSELKSRNLAFLSITPFEKVPLEAEVVITTESERGFVNHQKVLVYNTAVDPAAIVNEAVRIVEGKGIYENLVVGVDPGKTFGLALLGDGVVLKTFTCPNANEAINKITDIFREQRGATRVLRVGKWSLSNTTEFLSSLNKNLPEDVMIEIVSEAGTSRLMGESVHKRGLRHTISAVKIAERRGHPYRRRRGET